MGGIFSMRARAGERGSWPYVVVVVVVVLELEEEGG